MYDLSVFLFLPPLCGDRDVSVDLRPFSDLDECCVVVLPIVPFLASVSPYCFVHPAWLGVCGPIEISIRVIVDSSDLPHSVRFFFCIVFST